MEFDQYWRNSWHVMRRKQRLINDNDMRRTLYAYDKARKIFILQWQGFPPEQVNGMAEELVIGEPSDQLIYGVIRRHFRDGEEKEEQRRIIIGI